MKFFFYNHYLVILIAIHKSYNNRNNLNFNFELSIHMFHLSIFRDTTLINIQKYKKIFLHYMYNIFCYKTNFKNLLKHSICFVNVLL